MNSTILLLVITSPTYNYLKYSLIGIFLLECRTPKSVVLSWLLYSSILLWPLGKIKHGFGVIFFLSAIILNDNNVSDSHEMLILMDSPKVLHLDSSSSLYINANMHFGMK